MDNIKFINNDDNMIYKPEKYTDSYYQFCQFKNPFSNLYETRKIVFNEMGQILKVFVKPYSGSVIKKFMKQHACNKFKLFPVREIKYVELPNTSDLLIAHSSLINNRVTEYGEMKL